MRPSTKLRWEKVADENILGYKIYWRDTTSPQWQYSRFAGDVDNFTLENIVVDNFFGGDGSIHAKIEGREFTSFGSSMIIPVPFNGFIFTFDFLVKSGNLTFQFPYTFCIDSFYLEGQYCIQTLWNIIPFLRGRGNFIIIEYVELYLVEALRN